jgi:nitroimidazol reductase NimA-like FMN-containing flavoprotein (pyridoxamine 5'-phosphate oxidase superfamily)
MSVGQRQLTELDRSQALRLLGSVALGRIVFTRHAMPAIRPVNHVLDAGHIIIRSHSGAAVVSEADTDCGVVVAYEADDIDPVTHLGWSVVVTGTAYLVTDAGEKGRYQQLLTPWLDGEMDQVIRIRPAIVTGFRLGSQG